MRGLAPQITPVYIGRVARGDFAKSSTVHRGAIGISAIVLAVVILRNGWIGDDAYISFRTVSNFVHGYGLTWNIDERVQAFTNPLWVFLLAIVHFFTGEIYLTVILLSTLTSVLAVLLLMKTQCDTLRQVILVLLLFVFSRAFMDFATSGLENPLTNLLLVVFGAIWFSRTNSRRRISLLALTASLCALNRLDTILLTLPAVLTACLQVPFLKHLKLAVIGFLPLIIWEAFSIVYYGFPFPNTYYAKVQAGIPWGELSRQGFAYFVDALNNDPLTLLVIFTGLFLAVRNRRRSFLPLAAGIALYLLYIIRIGGDFMSGRFFVAPFVISAVIIARHRLPASGTALWIPLAATVLIGLTSPLPPIFIDKSYSHRVIPASGIADEKGWYYQATGFLQLKRNASENNLGWEMRGKVDRLSGIPVKVVSSVGFEGFAAGAGCHIIDTYGLSDPLLARLPNLRRRGWRIGHFFRTLPRGYQQTLETGVGRFTDAGLAAFYDTLSLIVRGPIFSWKRFKAIWKMNTGGYEYLKDSYLGSSALHVNYEQLSDPKSPGTPWDAEGNLVLRPSGIEIILDSVCRVPFIEVSVDHNDYYQLVFFRDSLELGWLPIDKRIVPQGGLRVDTLVLPPLAAGGGFNRLFLYPWAGDDMYSLGHVKLLTNRDGNQ